MIEWHVRNRTLTRMHAHRLQNMIALNALAHVAHRQKVFGQKVKFPTIKIQTTQIKNSWNSMRTSY